MGAETINSQPTCICKSCGKYTGGKEFCDTRCRRMFMSSVQIEVLRKEVFDLTEEIKRIKNRLKDHLEETHGINY